jgi:hypothetical protein
MVHGRATVTKQLGISKFVLDSRHAIPTIVAVLSERLTAAFKHDITLDAGPPRRTIAVHSIDVIVGVDGVLGKVGFSELARSINRAFEGTGCAFFLPKHQSCGHGQCQEKEKGLDERQRDGISSQHFTSVCRVVVVVVVTVVVVVVVVIGCFVPLSSK